MNGDFDTIILVIKLFLLCTGGVFCYYGWGVYEDLIKFLGGVIGFTLGLILIYSLDIDSLLVGFIILIIFAVIGAELLWVVEEAMTFIGGAIFGFFVSKGIFLFQSIEYVHSLFSFSGFLDELFSISAVDIILAIIFGILGLIFYKFTVIAMTSSIGSFFISLSLFDFDYFFLFLLSGIVVQYGTLSYLGRSLEPTIKKEELTDDEKSIQVIICPSCGAENKIDAAFCKKCKKLLSREPQEVERESVPQTVLSKTSAEKGTEKIICPSCGTENKKGASYCKKCGKIL